MAELLGVDYDVLALDMTESESRQRALVSDPTPSSTPPALPEPGAIARPPTNASPPTTGPASAAQPTGPASPTSTRESDADANEAGTASPTADDHLDRKSTRLNSSH